MEIQMRALRGKVMPALLAAVLLVFGANLAAYAANGKPLLLGKTNKATKPTKVKNTQGGPALTLKTKPSSPPLAVSSGKKVAKLNADRLDGLDAAALQTTSRVYNLAPFDPPGSENSAVWVLGTVPTGWHQLSFDVGLLATDTAGCGLIGVKGSSETILAAATSAVISGVAVPSATVVTNLTGFDELGVSCFSNQPIRSMPNLKGQLALTKVDRATARPLGEGFLLPRMGRSFGPR
jgi:hypothetical protein